MRGRFDGGKGHRLSTLSDGGTVIRSPSTFHLRDHPAGVQEWKADLC